MKAITIRQPWASLIATGAKTIEARPRSTSYRGRIAIHAAKVDTDRWMLDHREAWGALGQAIGGAAPPRGAVVASAVLADCVPIVDRWGSGNDDGGFVLVVEDDGRLRLVGNGDVTDQLPYGDFSPGRWALLLDDIKPTTERCPWCWGGSVDTDGWCRVCDDELSCDPVPVRGQQAVPWEWTP